MNATQNPSAPTYDAVRVATLLVFKAAGVESRKCGLQPKRHLEFVTFFDPGWSILRLRDAVAKRGTIFCPQNRYNQAPFAKLEEPPRYRQLRMTALDGSLNKTFAQQQALLPADEEIPSARVVIMGMVIHFLATGERLFPGNWVRCIDKASLGRRVWVGDFHGDGLNVSHRWDADRDSGFGLASARKF